jgi:hypothetical protein
MGLSLTPLQRGALFTLSGAAYGLAFLSQASALRAQPAPSSLRLPAQVEPQAIIVANSIRRDPFAPTPAPRHFEQRARDEVSSSVDGAGFAPVPPGLSVPSIDGVAETVAGPPRTLLLKATIAGTSPVAYVEAANAMTIVRPGDVVSGLRVRLIDLRGVEFDDGTRLDLPDRASPTIAPQPAPPHAGSTPLSLPSAEASDTPAPAAGYPSPGPLPTPKPGAYPLGSRPTSDPAAPTALPYPYPYAPH